MFFNNDLIFNKTWEEHLQHFNVVLRIMEEQSLLPTGSKCEFGLIEIMYIGYLIGANGVKVHQQKIQAILDWPSPRNVSNLIGFLRLYSCYMSIDKEFSQLISFLTNLTQKGAL